MFSKNDIDRSLRESLTVNTKDCPLYVTPRSKYYLLYSILHYNVNI